MATGSDSRPRPQLLIWAMAAASIAAAAIAVYLGWLRSGTYNDECVPSARSKTLLQQTWVVGSIAICLSSAALLGLYFRGDASVRRGALAFVIWALVVIASVAATVGGGLCLTLPTP